MRLYLILLSSFTNNDSLLNVPATCLNGTRRMGKTTAKNNCREKKRLNVRRRNNAPNWTRRDSGGLFAHHQSHIHATQPKPPEMPRGGGPITEGATSLKDAGHLSVGEQASVFLLKRKKPNVNYKRSGYSHFSIPPVSVASAGISRGRLGSARNNAAPNCSGGAALDGSSSGSLTTVSSGPVPPRVCKGPARPSAAPLIFPLPPMDSPRTPHL